MGFFGWMESTPGTQFPGTGYPDTGYPDTWYLGNTNSNNLLWTRQGRSSTRAQRLSLRDFVDRNSCLANDADAKRFVKCLPRVAYPGYDCCPKPYPVPRKHEGIEAEGNVSSRVPGYPGTGAGYRRHDLRSCGDCGRARVPGTSTR
eukprot:2341889-Rhodomonas_salina.1